MMSSSRLMGSRRKGKTAVPDLQQYIDNGFPEEFPPASHMGASKKAAAAPVRARPRRRALVVSVTHPHNGALAARLCAMLGFDEIDVIGAHAAGRISGEEYRRRAIAQARGHADAPQAGAPPTRAAIMQGLLWLVSGAIPGDTLALFYTGRGGGVFGAGSLEGEALVPVDYETAGVIGEATLREYLFEPACEAGAILRVVLDMDDSGVGLVLNHNAYDAAAAAEDIAQANPHNEVYARFAARGMRVPAVAPPPRWIEWAADSKPKEVAELGAGNVSAPSADNVSAPSADKVSAPSEDKVSAPSEGKVSALSADKVSAPPAVCVLMSAHPSRPAITEVLLRRLVAKSVAVSDILRDGRLSGADRVQVGCCEPISAATPFIACP